MTEDKPFKLPPPATVADMCAALAWDDDVCDHTRLALEMAADTIRALMGRVTANARQLELSEADRENLLTLIDRRLQRGNP